MTRRIKDSALDSRAARGPSDFWLWSRWYAHRCYASRELI